MKKFLTYTTVITLICAAIYAIVMDARDMAEYTYKIDTIGSNRETYHCKQYFSEQPGCISFTSREAGFIQLCGSYKITRNN